MCAQRLKKVVKGGRERERDFLGLICVCAYLSWVEVAAVMCGGSGHYNKTNWSCELKLRDREETNSTFNF